jgi:hypothetical protein
MLSRDTPGFPETLRCGRYLPCPDFQSLLTELSLHPSKGGRRCTGEETAGVLSGRPDSETAAEPAVSYPPRRNVDVPMADGVTLRADVWLPAGGTRLVIPITSG